MKSEFICKAALATVSYIQDLEIIDVSKCEDGSFDLRYTININTKEFNHGGKLKIVGDKVVGGFYDAKGRLTPMEQQKIEFKECGESLIIISTFNDYKEEREFLEWATYKKA